MKHLFTEKDFVLRGETPEEIIDLYISSATEKTVPGLRNSLTKAFKRAVTNKKPDEIPGITVYQDRDSEWFYLVEKDRYDPAAIVTILFDLLTDPVETGKGPEEALIRADLIDKSIGYIEECEDMDLEETIQKLKELTGRFCETLSMVNEEELSETELNRLSDDIDETFYGPIAELLSDILPQIEQKILGLEVQDDE